MRFRSSSVMLLSALAMAPNAVGQVPVQFGPVNWNATTVFSAALGTRVGTYAGSISGGPTIAWFCTDYANTIYGSGAFSAYITNVNDANGIFTKTRYGSSFANAAAAVAAYKQASFLTQFFAVTPNTEWASIHSAIWQIFDPATPTIAPGSGASGTNYWLALAASQYHTYDYTNVYVITDVNAVGKGACTTHNTPNASCGNQEFMFGNPTVVPEPVSMTLLGTGLAGVFAAGRRRRKQNRA